MIMPPNQFNKNKKVNPKIGFEPAYTSSYQIDILFRAPCFVDSDRTSKQT